MDYSNIQIDPASIVPVKSAPAKDINSIIKDASYKNGIPEPILRSLVNAESGGNKNALSPKGAMGAAQLMPATAKEMGVTDPNDLEQNINGGAKYLKQQYDKFGDWKLAAAAYNAGPGNVQKYGGVPPFPETQNYVNKVAKDAPQASPAKNDFSDIKIDPSSITPLGQKQVAEEPKKSLLEGLLERGHFTPPSSEDADKSKRALISGAASQIPGSNLAAAGGEQLFNKIEDLLGIQGKDTSIRRNRDFKGSYDYAQNQGKQMQEGDPLAANVGKIGMAIPEYTTGMGALGVTKATPLLGRIAAGGLTSAAVGQAGRSEVNPTATALDTLLGIGGEAIPGAVGKVGEGINKVGSVIADNVPKFSRMAHKVMEGVTGFGYSPLAVNREIAQETLQKGFQASEGARRASYDTGLADLEHMFNTQEVGRKTANDVSNSVLENNFNAQEEARKTAHATGLADLEGQFMSQESGRKADYIGERKSASDSAQELKSSQASKAYGEIVNPLEEQAGDKTVSGQPIRDKINSFLSKKGFIDPKGNIDSQKISDLSAPEVKDFYSQLSNMSERLKKNPSIPDLKVMKEELSAMRGKAKFSSDQVRQFDDMTRGINESYDNLIGELAGPEGKSSVQQARSSYRSEKTLNDILDEGSTGKRLTKAIEDRGRDKLKEVLTSDQYQKLMDTESRMVNSEKPFQKSMKPEAIPFQKGTPPELTPFQRAIKPEAIPFQKGTPPEWLPQRTASIVSNSADKMKGLGSILQNAGIGGQSLSNLTTPYGLTLLEQLFNGGK